jgi:hypothetical protein
MDMNIRILGRRLAPAAAGALLLAGLGFANAAFACDPASAHGDAKADKVIVLSNHRHSGDGERRVRVMHDGAMAVADCGGERAAVSESTDGDRERTRIILCGKGDLTDAQRVEKLERALARISANEELSAEHKEKVTAALRAAIERLRSAR